MAIAPKIVTGTIKDVKHIVVLMQENRSFDHYLGSLRGVRGFGDPRAVMRYRYQLAAHRLQADATAHIAAETVSIAFENAGTVGAFFHVRTAQGAQNSGQGTGPWGYTLDPATRELSDRWSPTTGTAYDLSVYGPNGFFRRFAGGLSQASANLSLQVVPELDGVLLAVIIRNATSSPTTALVANQYTEQQERVFLAPGAELTVPVVTRFNWYDVIVTTGSDSSFVRHYAGHIENGFDSVTDPHIGAAT
jgi:phospholipase C